MTAGMVQVFLCLLFVALTRANKHNVETSTMSRAELVKLVEEMRSNYNPTRYEREMSMKYSVLTSPDDASYEKGAQEVTTEWFELLTEPENEEHAETFQPTHEVVLPIQEHPPPAEESYDEHPVYVGSSRGIAGFNYPNYLDIPETSFTCMDQDIIPGFYADLETGCQVFHACWPHRRESFLCPVGTIFNQALLACDSWYNSNCSLAPLYYKVNARAYHQVHEESESGTVGSMIDILIEKDHRDGSDVFLQATTVEKETTKAEPDVSYLKKFPPIKAKVTVYPETSDQKSEIIAEASLGRKKIVKRPAVVMEKPAVQKYHYSLIKHIHIPSVSEIVDEIFDVAKKIVEESRDLASRLTTEHMKLYKPKTLSSLNPMFIVKPVEVENIPKEPVKDSQLFIQTQPKSLKLVKKLLYKPNVRATTVKRVSPLTRKVLAGNYLKLLKMKG